MVFPPSVVSKAKSSFSLMARRSRRLPSCHAALLASNWDIPGFADKMRCAAWSGLKYSAPCCNSIAPIRLLLPAPFVPAST